MCIIIEGRRWGMILGNGVDIVEIERIESMIQGKKRFLEKIFTAKERALFEEKANKPETIAANFAAKEAVSKAFGTGIRGISFDEIEILRDELGKPYVNFYGNAKGFAEKMGVRKCHVSLSHSKENAIAFVILTDENA